LTKGVNLVVKGTGPRGEKKKKMRLFDKTFKKKAILKRGGRSSWEWGFFLGGREEKKSPTKSLL